jgi:hypothetical protein
LIRSLGGFQLLSDISTMLNVTCGIV